MAISALCMLAASGCASNKPNSLAPAAPRSASPDGADQADNSVTEETLPAAVESPSTATLTGRLIDLDPAVRWACSYSGIAVEAVEKPSDSVRVYRMTDARHTPLRIELICEDFTRGHFKQREIAATATFGRFPDTARQSRLLRKIQQRLDQLAKRKR